MCKLLSKFEALTIQDSMLQNLICLLFKNLLKVYLNSCSEKRNYTFQNNNDLVHSLKVVFLILWFSTPGQQPANSWWLLGER